MFGYSSYLDKSMNGIKTISDGVALIQNGNATFNTINVETITSSNLTDCNLNNCTTNDPTTPQSVANKEYVDDNFVDRTHNLSQDINGEKTFINDITAPNIFCNTALYLKDYQSLPSPTTYSSILVQNSDILNFDADFNNNKFQFKVSSNAVLLLDSTNTTVFNNLNCSSSLISNNITAPSSTTNGINNIFTNLS